MKNKHDFLHIIVILFSVVSVCVAENVKKSIDDNRDDTGDINDEAKDESLDIPIENDANLTCTRRQNSQLHEIKSATYKQFPFMAMIMSQQSEYLCSGVVVSNGLILTTAKCTGLPVSYVLLNATKDKIDDTTTMLHVIKSEKFPTFRGVESIKDIGIIYTEKHNSSVSSKIRLSNFTNVRNIIDVEAIGYGLNSDTGSTKELQYIGMELRPPIEGGEILKAYFDCVDTKVPTCFRDTGSAAIFDNELIGIVSQGQEDCTKEMTSTYAINKKMADIVPSFTFKAWLDERIKKNEESLTEDSLSIYPNSPVVAKRRMMNKLTDSANMSERSHKIFTIFYPILLFSAFVLV